MKTKNPINFLFITIIFVIVFLIAMFFAAYEPQDPPREYITRKIVKAKNQGEETTYRYKYNIWKGNFYHQPDIHTVYYLIYTDGSYDKVNVGKFTITNVGDTVVGKYYR